jgi:3-methyladenine DNA glycosylase/8-oxoguanine DNA glycosylase
MARPRTVRHADPWADAVEHLRRADHPEWPSLIERVGPCQLRPRADRFDTLVRAIVGQQLSTKVAGTIDSRLRALGGPSHTPDALLALGEGRVRSAGISAGKTRTILDLAAAVARGDIPLETLDRQEDHEIIARLTTIKGIGAWTAEMFLIFSLNRPDVLPVADLGIRVAIRDLHGLAELPKPRQCRDLAEPWRPYRSVASWYLWRRLDLAKT